MQREHFNEIFDRFMKTFDANPGARKDQRERWWCAFGHKDRRVVMAALDGIIQNIRANIDLGGGNPAPPNRIKIEEAIDRIEKKSRKPVERILPSCDLCSGKGTVPLVKIPGGKYGHPMDIMMFNFLVSAGIDGFFGDFINTSKTLCFSCRCQAGAPWDAGTHFPPLARYEVPLLDERFHGLWEKHNHEIPEIDSVAEAVKNLSAGFKKKQDDPEPVDDPEYPEHAAVEDSGESESGGGIPVTPSEPVVDDDLPF